MELTILDTELNPVKILDSYDSLVWTDRYCAAGDFNLRVEANDKALEYCKEDFYIKNPNSEHLMYIDNISTDDNRDLGDMIVISGKSIEEFLSRRVMDSQIKSIIEVEAGIKTAINRFFISPTDTKRKISNMVYKNSTVPEQYRMFIGNHYNDIGVSVYDFIINECNHQDYDIPYNEATPLMLGFKLTLDELKKFVFELYLGRNRIPYESKKDVNAVTFSKDFNNIVDLEYTRSNEAWKNTGLVRGNYKTYSNGQWVDNYVNYTIGYKYKDENNVGTIYSGVARREIFLDETSVSNINEVTNQPIAANTYKSLICNEGAKQMDDYDIVSDTSAEVVPYSQFVYGKDYDLGDFVRFSSKVSGIANAQITEVTTSYDQQGLRIFPTFNILPSYYDIPDYPPEDSKFKTGQS